MFCSLGVPFLTMGDERWRTQLGNNNAYCQDNQTSWMDWSESDDAEMLLQFTRRLARFRREHPELRRSRHFSGDVDPLSERRDVDWLDELGEPMSHHKWHEPARKFFAAQIDRGAAGAMLLLYNSTAVSISFPLPTGAWRLIFDTALDDSFPPAGRRSAPGKSFLSSARSLACLRLVEKSRAAAGGDG
jgi:isoamylase